MDIKFKTIVLFTFSLATFFISFMVQALNLALPQIGWEFEADAILLNWAVLAYSLSVAAFSVPFGRIADIVGIKKIILIGLIIYTISSVVALFSTSIIMLIVCRLVQGMGAAMILVGIMALISLIFPAEERGRAYGINVTGVYVGSSVGPFLGGLLTQYFGWRSIFITAIPVGIILILLILWLIKGEWAESRGQKYDYIGSVVYVLSLITLMYGFSLLPEPVGAAVVVGGIIGILLFLRWESRTDSPMFNIQIFRHNRTFIFTNLAALLNYMGIFAMAFILSLFLQYIQGFTPDGAGLIMIAFPVVQAMLSPLAGRLSDKIEPRLVASLGLALSTVALFLFIFLAADTPVWQIIIALIILGTGVALFISPNTNALMSSTPPRYYGVASATMSTMISFGQTLSMGITMVVMAVIIGRVAITPEYFPDFLTSTRVAFSIFTLLCAGGIFISLFRGKVTY